MSRVQFGYVFGFLAVWLAWAAGWVVLPAIVAGVAVVVAIRAIELHADRNHWRQRLGLHEPASHRRHLSHEPVASEASPASDRRATSDEDTLVTTVRHRHESEEG